MSTIDDAVQTLQTGDMLRVVYKPEFQIYIGKANLGTKEFIGTYEGNDPKKRTLSMTRSIIDLAAVKIVVPWTVPYDKIEVLQKVTLQDLVRKY